MPFSKANSKLVQTARHQPTFKRVEEEILDLFRIIVISKKTAL